MEIEYQCQLLIGYYTVDSHIRLHCELVGHLAWEVREEKEVTHSIPMNVLLNGMRGEEGRIPVYKELSEWQVALLLLLLHIPVNIHKLENIG